MSRTKYVEYRDEGFWAYDVALGVLLKHIIDTAAAHNPTAADAWLAEAVPHWRQIAVISDYGFSLDRHVPASGIELFKVLIRKSCELLAMREAIPASEAESWKILEDLGLFARGHDPIPTKPIIALGRAILALIDGTLPPAPRGTAWIYALDDMPQTIGMRDR